METFLELIAEALERDLDTVKGEDKFREYPEWDSLSHLTVISLIDEQYELVIPRAEFTGMQTLAEVYHYISNNSQ